MHNLFQGNLKAFYNSRFDTCTRDIEAGTGNACISSENGSSSGNDV